MPNQSATSGCIRPEGRGRERVRLIRASLALSRYMLSALADPTTSAVPASAMSTAHGLPELGAIRAPQAIVTMTSANTRGLVSSNSSNRTEMRAPGWGSGPNRRQFRVEVVTEIRGKTFA
jgi:hypothetical protein